MPSNDHFLTLFRYFRAYLCTVEISVLSTLFFVASSQAETQDNDEQVWITETLQIFHAPEQDKLLDTFGNAADSSIFAIPALPSQDAGPEVWKAYFSESDRICRNYVSLWEWYFPKGTLFAFDHITQTLAIYTHAEAKSNIDKWRNFNKEDFPYLVNLSTEIIEADASVIGPIITEGLRLNDHDGMWNKIQTLIKEGRALSVEKVNLTSSEISEAMISQGAESRMLNSLTLDQEGRPIFEYDDQSSFMLRVERAYPSSYGKPTGRVDLAATLFQSNGSPIHRIQDTRDLGDQLPQQVEWYDWNRAQLKYQGFASDGKARLAGSWTTAQGGEQPTRQTAVFLRADTTYLLPEPNEKLKDILKQHAALAPEKPSGPTQQLTLPKPPPGMIVKELPIPEFFFYYVGRDIRNNARQTTLGFLINEAGIPLPQYSQVNYKSSTGIALVTTTPEAMAKIEEFFADIERQSLPDGLNYHLQILEGAPVDFSELVKNGSSPSWQSLQPLIKQGRLAIIEDIILVGKGSYETEADFGTFVQNLARGDTPDSPAIQLINSNIGTSIHILPEAGLKKDRLPVQISLQQQTRRNADSLPISICDLSQLHIELPLEEACYLGSWSFHEVDPAKAGRHKTRMAFLTITKTGPY